MTKIRKHRLEHLNLCFLKIVSDFGQFYKIRRASDFDEKWLSIYKFLKVSFNLLKSGKTFVMPCHKKVYT
jgi:hypothetical protein